MTFSLLRKMAAVGAVVVGLVFASASANANAASSKPTKVHVSNVNTVNTKFTQNSGQMRSLDDWWF